MTNDVICEPEGVYVFFVRSLLWIPTPGFNQSSRDELGKYSSPVCLSVRLVGGATACLLGVYGLS